LVNSAIFSFPQDSSAADIRLSSGKFDAEIWAVCYVELGKNTKRTYVPLQQLDKFFLLSENDIGTQYMSTHARNPTA
jgi:hypothetical protein